ncbi:MAG: NAD(P)/FAD-dependent oxidoreductase [Dehalococcoidia bacterium]|nr:NAD(P)/FAD-dependent oxidoreductase [Dehalococcoidia bacterium]MSQ17660.1 NAD(P)/FAD-dependent oxidoreductase [Dehalococcoidia bacterium]
MCAIEAGNRGRRVLVLDHANKAGKKILISGGGRCNFTNLYATPDDFQSQNKPFCVSALSRYIPQDFISLVEKHRIPYHEKKLGQLFCDGSAQEIVRMLLDEAAAAGVTVRLSCQVTGIRREGEVLGFLVETDLGAVAAGSLAVATGGLSIPKMGATGFAYTVARQFGLDVTPTRPALVPLTASGRNLEFCRNLAGVSIPCIARCNGASFTENLLFTHKGISGPAVLQVSSHWREGQQLHIDLLPGLDPLTHLQAQQAARPKAELRTILSALLPRSFSEAMCGTYLPNRAMGQLSHQELAAVGHTLKDWTISCDGTEGYRTAEVTLGGVDSTGLSSKTLEAIKAPGLFFIGEAVDVTGPLGGYNFQWAWASGYCAGQYV